MKQMDITQEMMESEPQETPPLPGKIGDYILVTVPKVWGSFQYRLGTDDTQIGFVFEPYTNTAVIVALPLKDDPREFMECVNEYVSDMPEGDRADSVKFFKGVLTLEEFEYILKLRARLEVINQREKYNELQKKDKGF